MHDIVYNLIDLGAMNRNTNVYDQFCLNQFDAMTEAISLWPNANRYLSKLRRLRGNLLECLRKAFDPELNQFNTLIHGDLYVKVHSYLILQQLSSIIYIFQMDQ